MILRIPLQIYLQFLAMFRIAQQITLSTKVHFRSHACNVQICVVLGPLTLRKQLIIQNLFTVASGTITHTYTIQTH